jgi:hypothetical protein
MLAWAPGGVKAIKAMIAMVNVGQFFAMIPPPAIQGE